MNTALPITLVCAALLCSCSFSKARSPQPALDDPMDGIRNLSLEAGPNTDMDYAPREQNMVAQYNALLERFQRLETGSAEQARRIEELDTLLAGARTNAQTEQNRKAQAQAESRELRTQLRELQGRILTLSIQKAEIEQQLLQFRIAQARTDLGTEAEAEARNRARARPFGRGRLK